MEENSSQVVTAGVTGYERTIFESRLKWTLFLRLIIAIFGLAAILLDQRNLWTSPPRLVGAYITLIFACFVNIIYLLSIHRSTIGLKRLAVIQITIDILLETLLVYFTGGMRGSIFIYLYFASVVSSALLVSARSSFIFASLASIFLSGITITYFLATHFHSPLPFLTADYVKEMTSALSFILPYLFFFALALHLVAFLAGILTLELSQERILKGEVLQGISSGLIVTDRDAKIVFCNDRAKVLLNLPEHVPLHGVKIENLLTRKETSPLREALLNNIFTRGEMVMPVGLKPAYREFITTILKGSGGKIRGAIALINDITLNREIEEVSRRAAKWQSLSEMGTSIAHEIRNPLTSIKSAAQELGTLNVLSANDKKLLQIIVKESARLNQIISDFLDFTREQPLSFRECDLTGMLDEVIMLLERRELPPSRVKISREFKGILKCRCDAEHLKQVFLNIGINALESGTDRIVFRAYRSGLPEGIFVEIVDFGKGIEDEYLQKIFDPFVTSKTKGVGMGLAISHKIIQLHKGYISAESKPGKGAKFTIWLPLG